ncbi:hypothetical protein K431DRAFT_338834 [Polychaeton citri CBS 116435]|uniref:RING-type domain-containing protein n=1 Tax=Polychaeton citri CBS 116435 TaxID=1314669 RepID=A0A9P4Q8W1_9PEZI|nr:hypothetical protein K431DRAFT_338834 [Polychaeton citri CBS 116435]
MSAQSITAFPVIIPNVPPSPENTDIFQQPVPPDFSAYHNTFDDISTLSTNTVSQGDTIRGVLYTPDFPPHDVCINATGGYIPVNATRKANIPEYVDQFIAIAPWVSPGCTLEYLKTAGQDTASAFIFFLPGTGSTDPPMPNDVAWTLGDGESWKRNSQFPVYAMSESAASILLGAMSLYHGNMTDVPWGHNLTEEYDSRYYVRMSMLITTGSRDHIPSLWVFLLIVLAILLAIIGATSVSMHWLQRRRRQTLRQRVVEGEVDLEALGIKRLTVPQNLLDQMPLYTYGTSTPVGSSKSGASATEKSAVVAEVRPASPPPSGRPSPAMRAHSYRPTAAQQPTCAICLDDFVAPSGTSTSTSSTEIETETTTPGTTVRELPCRHIFHPECVDAFLRESSSLCPLCKKTVLPQGYCPRNITNAMVRRERILRRMRERMDGGDDGHLSDDEEDSDQTSPQQRSSTLPLSSLTGRLRSSTRTFSGFSGFSDRRISSAPPVIGTEMTTVTTPAAVATSLSRGQADQQQSSRVIQPSSNPTRRNWARRRAEAMLGNSRLRAPLDPEAEEARAIPRWRKAVQGVFPGFRR